MIDWTVERGAMKAQAGMNRDQKGGYGHICIEGKASKAAGGGLFIKGGFFNKALYSSKRKSLFGPASTAMVLYMMGMVPLGMG